jgi:NAD dependent epimerase/dehydratase family enzyme
VGDDDSRIYNLEKCPSIFFSTVANKTAALTSFIRSRKKKPDYAITLSTVSILTKKREKEITKWAYIDHVQSDMWKEKRPHLTWVYV